MNTTYLNRLFKESVGISIVNYMKEKRLRESIVLLCDYKNTINSIAESVGFSSANYYIVAFKQHYGVTPAQYRQNNLN